MVENIRKSGIDVIGDVPWGIHLCQFYRTKEDLIDILIPYFKAGLENNELCMWVTSEPLNKREAIRAVKEAVPHFEQYLKIGQIEIVPYKKWYLKGGVFDKQRVLNNWINKLNQVLAKGYDGIRVIGNTAWLEKRDWVCFTDYEEEINKVIDNHRMLTLCTYWLDKCVASEVIDVVSNHQVALVRREGNWESIKSIVHREAKMMHMESEEHFRQMAENIEEVFWMEDAKSGKILYVNPAYEHIFGLSTENAYRDSRYWLNIVHPDDCKEIAKRIEEGFAAKDKFVYRIIKQDGSIRWIHSRIFPIKDESGEVYRMVGIAEDITERKRVEEMILESREHYRSMLDNMLEGCQIIGFDWCYLYVNDAVAKQGRHSKEELIGHTMMEMYPGIEHTKMFAFLRLCMEKRTPHHMENEFTFPDGTKGWFKLGIYPVPEGIFISSIDITGHKQAEEKLKRSHDQLRKLATHLQSTREEERKSIAQEIHDELGTSLTALKMDASWLASRLPQDQKQLVKKIGSMLKLIDNTIQSVQRLSTELRPGMLDDLGLTAVVEWQAEEFQNRTGIRCSVTIRPELITNDGELSIAIFRIFQETLTNIARHAEATGVSINLTRERDNVVLTVADNGRGITEEQINNSHSFGLLGIRERAMSWGGEVKISGTRGRGTTVMVIIPVANE